MAIICIPHSAASLNLSEKTLKVKCPFCRITYTYQTNTKVVFSHECPEAQDQVFFLNGHALYGAAEYNKGEKPTK